MRPVGGEPRAQGPVAITAEAAVARRGWVTATAMAVGVLASSLFGAVALTSPASAYPSSSVTIEGHGYGHGHGMGQWGALGYALAQTGYSVHPGDLLRRDQPVRSAGTRRCDDHHAWT